MTLRENVQVCLALLPSKAHFPQRSHGGIAVPSSYLWENMRTVVGIFQGLGCGHLTRQMSGPAHSSVVLHIPAFGKKVLLASCVLGLLHLWPPTKRSCVLDAHCAALGRGLILCIAGGLYSQVVMG